MIQPEQHAEQGREHLDIYRPKLEELFSVSLEDLVVEDREAYLESRLFNYLLDPELKRKERKRDEKRLKRAAAMYDNYHRTIYMTWTKPLSDTSLAKNTVHEAAHAIHYTLMGEGLAKSVSSWPVWRIVQEGFAEYVSLETFQPYYVQPGMESNLERRVKWHKWMYEIYARNRLHRFHEYFLEGEIVVPWGLRESSRLKILFHKIRMWLVRFSSGSPDEYYHNVGYTFFKTAADAGVSPTDIIREPPQDLETILNPEEYVLRMRTAGKLL